ncbi:trypsin-like peptidase domain-containing protein, partial [bacterium]|nr:trypsin-like peptidase domain-containing protein [bacterium]
MSSIFQTTARTRAAQSACSIALLLTVLLVVPADAADRNAEPAAATHDVSPLASVQLFRADTVDHDVAKLEDLQAEGLGLPPRFAVPQETFITPDTHGTWERLDESTMLWRLRVGSSGALSLNLGFARYAMPAGGRLLIYPADGSAAAIAFDDADNKAHGELWTPLVESAELVVEVELPVKAVALLELELTAVNTGYRKFGDMFPEKAGTCNIDVVCAEGDDWRDDIQSVAVYQRSGSWACTGVMVNNTADDETPYFLTADHCGLTSSSDATLVVYWNFQSPVCGQQGGGSLAQFQSGSTFVTGSSASDFTLVQLDAAPDPAWNVAYAGWSNSSADPTSAVAIHHPSTDEKSISFEYDPCTTTSYLGTAVPGDGSHIRIEDWDVGTTEPGSSGSPLFDQDHHVVGQLHGGYAACGNNDSDWYGRVSVSWPAGLGTYLDPLGLGVTAWDLLAPYATGLRVSAGSYDGQGDQGGPFTPASFAYTLTNNGDTPLDYEASADVNWVDVGNATGSLAAGGQATVTVSFNANANALGIGSHNGTLGFVNVTNHDGDTTRAVNLQVGVPEIVYEWNMDTDPLWNAEGDWAWGQPQGSGGQYGNGDPTAGFTGAYVYGYNLAGDYPNSLPERHLTTQAIDCSGLEAVTLKFQRWLNVERPAYDHAYLRVSNDGVAYTTLWENGAEVTDNAWSQYAFDISAYADGQATVYLRWTQGTTDGSWQYSGWNIDDVEIW